MTKRGFFVEMDADDFAGLIEDLEALRTAVVESRTVEMRKGDALTYYARQLATLRRAELLG